MNEQVKQALKLIIENIVTETHKRRMLGAPIDEIKEDIIKYWLGDIK